jgi:predicted TPR repeat methyltransferase
MSSLTHPSVMPAAKAHGRAASLKQVLRRQLADGWARLWTAMETTGRLHAAPALLQQADRLQSTNPALAAALRDIARPNAATPSHTAAGTPSAVR